MTVRVERKGPVQVITMDRPERRNAFDGAMTRALDAALNDFEDDDDDLGLGNSSRKKAQASENGDAAAGAPQEEKAKAAEPERPGTFSAEVNRL